MKKSKILMLSLLAATALGSAAIAQARPGCEGGRAEYANRMPLRHEARHDHHLFMLGVCVGESLAQQGAQFNWPQDGSAPNPALQGAIQTAIEACRSAAVPNPQPSPSDSIAPAPAPSTAPSGSPVSGTTSAPISGPVGTTLSQ